MDVNDNGWVVDLDLYMLFQIHANLPVLSMSEDRTSVVYESTVPLRQLIKRSPCHTNRTTTYPVAPTPEPFFELGQKNY